MLRDWCSTTVRWARPQASSASTSTVWSTPALGDGAAAAPGDVRRGDVHVVDVAAGLADPVEQVAGADDVGAEALVDGRVEGDVAGAVHDGVQVGGQRGYVGEVALEDRDPAGQQGVGVLVEPGEDLLAEQRPCPFGAGGGARGRISRVEPHVGHLGQDQPQQRLADEAGHTGEQDVLARQRPRDVAHPRSLRQLAA